MREIRPIHDCEIEEYVALTVDAYPGMRAGGSEDRKRMTATLEARLDDDTMTMYVVKEDEEIVAVMRYHDFEMQLLSAKTLVGGLGGMAVSFNHKKRGLAHEVVAHFLGHYRERGACLTALYPFRPDFYRHMGFGYGSEVRHFRVLPASLPRVRPRPRFEVVTAGHIDEAAACYERFRRRTNGLFTRRRRFWESLLKNLEIYKVGVRRDGRLSGYMLFQFALGPEDNFIRNDLQVREIVYDTPRDLEALLTYLHLQGDQVGRILVNTQDEGFHLLLDDPRNGSGNLLPSVLAHETNVAGLGIMYRVVDTRRLFEVLSEHDFGGQSGTVSVNVVDPMLEANDGSTVVVFENGRAEVEDGGRYDVELSLGVAEFSSLIVGAARVRSLVDLGLAEVSDPTWVPTLDRLFAAPRPLCWTDF